MNITLPQIVLGTLAMALLTIGIAWALGGFDSLGIAGSTALVLGITVSYAVGIGLMAAVFYSNRRHDQAAHDAAQAHFKR
jgi:hypothetical protein